MGEHAIATGDVLAALRDLPDNAFDGLLCDPPYGLRFMAKRWDYDVPSVEVWREALRVLKPGAALLSFGGSRTFHRIAIGIEDAGFELRDCLTWLYGKGFPKSLNVSKAIDAAAGATRPVVGQQTLTGNAAVSLKDKGGTYGVQVGVAAAKTIDITGPATPLAQAWDGYGTALKPGWEPIILARKPLDGTVANNVTTWGTGALAIDACRLDRAEGDESGWSKTGSHAGPNLAMSGGNTARDPKPDADGRWPANVALDEVAAAMLDAEVGNRPSRPSVTRNGGGNAGGAVFANRVGGARPDSGYSDSGGPSRFFKSVTSNFTPPSSAPGDLVSRFLYSAKVSTKERELGCDALPKRSAGECTDREDGTDGLSSPRAGAGRTGGARNHHPTLKPIALTRWLARLIMPPPSRRDAALLVPYSGAGSEMIGALLAGWPLVFGIEGEADYVQIAQARIAAHTREAA